MVETALTTITLREHQRLETDLLTRTQAQLLKARFGKYLDVTASWDSGFTHLKAKQYVGFIILDDLRIEIQPKVPLDNLFFMLTYAYDMPEFRREVTSLTAAEALFEFIVELFARQVEQLARRGVYRQYIDFHRNEAYLRGRLQLNSHLQRNAVHPQRFFQQVNEFTPDVLENRILNATLWQLSRAALSLDLRRHVRRAGAAFAAVSLVPITPLDCRDVNYNRLNRHYRSPIALAQLLLQHLSLEAHAGKSPFLSFLFDMNLVFELFIARYLQEYFAAHDPALAVEIQSQIWLDAERKEKAKPDIILRSDGVRYLVLDTKYKTFARSPERSDLNQMVIYSYSMKLSRGILIYADDNPVHYHARFQDINLQAVSLSLSGPLDAFRARCAEFARRLAAQIQ